MIKKIVSIIMIVLLSGCATHYSSINKKGTDVYEVIVCQEEEILDAAYEAIERRFPYTSITPLAGDKLGFSFYVQPLLDRTNFDFVINKVEGISNGNKIVGYVYLVKSHGTQFFVNSRYVKPLIKEFESVLVKKNIMLARASSIKFVK